MAKRPSVTSIASGYASTTAINANTTALAAGFDNTLSLDGSTPNAMGADFDLGNNDILNGGTATFTEVTIGGVGLAAKAAAASTSASEAASSATAAASSASAAATSASSASTSASAATTAKNAAETAETNAETAETNAETAQAAAESASSTATTQASTATTKASEAASSATAAASSATAAASSATAAASSATAAAASYDSFDDRYLGAKSSAPTQDNDGDSLLTGALYFNSSNNNLYVWNGSSWQITAVSTSGLLQASNNLSDVSNAGTARTNLGLGTAAVAATGISSGNVAVFTSGVADDDFLRISGTSVEGRSSTELLSDIGATTATAAADEATALAIALG